MAPEAYGRYDAGHGQGREVSLHWYFLCLAAHQHHRELFVILYVHDIELECHCLGWNSLPLENLHLYAVSVLNTEHTCSTAHTTRPVNAA